MNPNSYSQLPNTYLVCHCLRIPKVTVFHIDCPASW